MDVALWCVVAALAPSSHYHTCCNICTCNVDIYLLLLLGAGMIWEQIGAFQSGGAPTVVPPEGIATPMES